MENTDGKPQKAWVTKVLNHPRALLILCLISFIEASVFPIPPYVLLVPMCAAMPEKAWRIALFGSLSSVAGGFVGYGIGFMAAEHAQALIAHWGYEQVFEKTKEFVNTYGGLSILASAVTPMPYKVMTITAGLFSMNILVFLVTSLLARGARFFFAAFVAAKISTVIRSRRQTRDLSP